MRAASRSSGGLPATARRPGGLPIADWPDGATWEHTWMAHRHADFSLTLEQSPVVTEVGMPARPTRSSAQNPGLP